MTVSDEPRGRNRWSKNVSVEKKMAFLFDKYLLFEKFLVFAWNWKKKRYQPPVFEKTRTLASATQWPKSNKLSSDSESAHSKTPLAGFSKKLKYQKLPSLKSKTIPPVRLHSAQQGSPPAKNDFQRLYFIG